MHPKCNNATALSNQDGGDIGLAKVVALEEQRLPPCRCQCIRKAVAEVESGRVTTLPESTPGPTAKFICSVSTAALVASIESNNSSRSPVASGPLLASTTIVASTTLTTETAIGATALSIAVTRSASTSPKDNRDQR
jgi:hypothetical protein